MKLLLSTKTSDVVKQRLYLPFVLILLLAFVGCSRSVETVPLRFGDPVWQDGEQSTYMITDIEGNFAGTLTLALTAGTSSGDTGWTVQRDISSSTKELVTVEVNERLRPQTALLLRIDSLGEEKVSTRYSGGETDIELTNKRNMVSYERMSLPSNAYDERTLLPFARALPFADGYATQLNSFLPIVGQLERVVVRVSEREEISVPAGSFDTWHIILETPTRETEAWIGTAAPFPLVKFIDGRNGGTFELKE